MASRSPRAFPALLILSCAFIFGSDPLPGQGIAEWQLLTADHYLEQRLEQQRELLFHALPLWAMVVNLVAALILVVVWRRQRNVAQFNWLIGISLTGNGYFLAVLSGGLIDPLVSDILVTAWFYFLSRLLYNYPSVRMQRLLGTLPIGAIMLYGMAGMVDSPVLHAAVTGGYSLGLWLLSSHQIGIRLARPLTPKLTLVLGVWLLTLLGIVDSLIIITGFELAAHPGMTLQLVPVGQIVGVLAALYYLVARHTENQQQLELLNASLDQRVNAAEAELEERYRMLTRDALDAAAMRERKTIYHSIHEDLSDKLLQLIYAARSPETADLARSALAELRDSRKLHPEEDRPLTDILADALVEIQGRCDQAGLLLHWRVDDALQRCKVNARQESALTRTLREAVSNLLKHAQASEVAIDFAADRRSQEHEVAPESWLIYTVTDNGRGISADHRTGRGLVNMRNRTKELGGTVDIATASPRGTQLRFALPLQQGAI